MEMRLLAMNSQPSENLPILELSGQGQRKIFVGMRLSGLRFRQLMTFIPVIPLALLRTVQR